MIYFYSIFVINSFSRHLTYHQGCQIRPQNELDCLKCDKYRNFSGQIAVHFGSPIQKVLKFDLKKSQSCLIWGPIGPASDIHAYLWYVFFYARAKSGICVNWRRLFTKVTTQFGLAISQLHWLCTILQYFGQSWGEKSLFTNLW